MIKEKKVVPLERNNLFFFDPRPGIPTFSVRLRLSSKSSHARRR